MLYNAIVTTDDGEYIYQNIEARSEQHLVDKIHRHFDDEDEIIEIKIKKTFGEEFNYD